MHLLILGINHKTAPLDVREKVAFTSEQLHTALRDLKNRSGAEEVAILSTCNRTEIYCHLENPKNLCVSTWLSAYQAMSNAELQPYTYQHWDHLAVRHMLRVASGLDSMIIGEPQILGQVKAAYQTACQAGTLGKLLKRLFQHSFSVAKQVRTDTHIGASPVSVAFAAVSLAKQIFANLAEQTALLIGAGDTIDLVSRHLRENRIKRLIVANRTLAHAYDLAAAVEGYAISLAEIPAHLAEVDIVIASTASPNYILDRQQIKSSLKKRKHRPILMVDIAVPRDIDPTVATLQDIYLYTVDDLQEIIQENLRSRQEAAKQAEEIVDTQTDNFMAWLRSQDSTSTIRALRSQAIKLRDDVYANAQQQLRQGKDPEEILTYLANTLTNKLIHAPSVALREASVQGRGDLVKAIKTLYNLKED